MKIGIFDPYLDTLGGGEQYILSIASCLSQKNQVYLFWDDISILHKANERFNISLKDIKLTENIFSSKTAFYKRLLASRKYDLIIFVSNGSIPFLLSKKNILIFQFPVNWVNGKDLLTVLKLKRVKHVICYSNFVKKFIDKTFQLNSIVLSPCINSMSLKKEKKENVILTVGRFTKDLNSKKHEILIDVFKKMCDQGLNAWKFIIIGSFLQRNRLYVEELRKRTENYPIEILSNIPFIELSRYYGISKIYWHATGFGENLQKHPERAEHFGISTVEAMGTGVVPVVINAGGQKEIVEDGKNGYLWDSLEDFMTKTNNLIKDKDLWEKMSKAAIKRSKMFNAEKFCNNLRNIIK